MCRQILSGSGESNPAPNHDISNNDMPDIGRLSLSFRHPLLLDSPPLTPTPMDSSRTHPPASPFDDTNSWSNATSTSEDEGGTFNVKLQSKLK